MKLFGGLLLLMMTAVQADNEGDTVTELPLAENCDREACVLPDCRCSGTDIPGGLAARNTPQFVTLTFEDGVHFENIDFYRSTIYNRVNSKGCRAGVTFYVSHEFTNYQYINELYNQGFEIGLHSVTHQYQSPETYWSEATYEDMVKEFGDQKTTMSHFANIPYDAMKGMRIPFNLLSGNASFQMMKEFGIEYDNTWPTVDNTNPGLWPYTLDYASTQDCVQPPCPSASFPGTWVMPIVAWRDEEDNPCWIVSSCPVLPDPWNEEAWYRFLVKNFERHYLGNRAPFGIHFIAAYLDPYIFVRRALVRFLNLVNSLNDVFMVNSHEVIDWVKNPVPVNVYRQQACPSIPFASCDATFCEELQASHSYSEYEMEICTTTCPRVFPWLGNPKGE